MLARRAVVAARSTVAIAAVAPARVSVPSRSIWQGYRDMRYPKKVEEPLVEARFQFLKPSKLPQQVYYDNEKVAALDVSFGILAAATVATCGAIYVAVGNDDHKH
jgi:hypothetical protein